MDEVSSHVRLDLPFLTARPPERLFRLVLESHDGRAPGADSEEKHEPVSDIDTVVVDSLKALDPEWPIREADIARRGRISIERKDYACGRSSSCVAAIRAKARSLSVNVTTTA